MNSSKRQRALRTWKIVIDEARTPVDTALAAYCNDEDSAFPNGSSRMKVHRFPEYAEGGRDVGFWHKSDVRIRPTDVGFWG